MSYRYTLTRSWGPTLDELVFVMLNPSTADDVEDDPTIRRCVGFAKRDGADQLSVVNLFAWRATKPVDIVDAAGAGMDVVGDRNDSHIEDAILRAGHLGCRLVFAWGANVTNHGNAFGHLAGERVGFVTEMARDYDAEPFCLGTTKHGHPRHPLMLRSDQPFEPWEAEQ